MKKIFLVPVRDWFIGGLDNGYTVHIWPGPRSFHNKNCYAIQVTWNKYVMSFLLTMISDRVKNGRSSLISTFSILFSLWTRSFAISASTLSHSSSIQDSRAASTSSFTRGTRLIFLSFPQNRSHVTNDHKSRDHEKPKIWFHFKPNGFKLLIMGEKGVKTINSIFIPEFMVFTSS